MEKKFPNNFGLKIQQKLDKCVFLSYKNSFVKFVSFSRRNSKFIFHSKVSTQKRRKQRMGSVTPQTKFFTTKHRQPITFTTDKTL